MLFSLNDILSFCKLNIFLLDVGIKIKKKFNAEVVLSTSNKKNQANFIMWVEDSNYLKHIK